MLEEKLKLIRKHDQEGRIKVMIIGLGSVGNYLLSYLLSTADEHLEIIVAGRNADKLQCDVNIARVAALIRRQNKTNVIVDGTCNLDDVDSIAALISKYQPDFIVNSSRVYPGLKYGSISWKNIRAYGIWTPLAIKYIRNIMLAYTKAEGKGIVINTSYSDGTIPWLKSSGVAYPDFGSGNLNHLLPRLKFAIANELGISDFWNIDVDIATAHFHDVVISKEGQNEGLEQLLKASYKGEEIKLDHVISGSAKGVLLFPETALPDGLTWDDVRRIWSSTNGLLPYDPTRGQARPEQMVVNNTDVGAYDMINLQLKLLEQVSGVSGTLQGVSTVGHNSASLYELQTHNATMALTDVYDTFADFCRQRDLLLAHSSPSA